MRPKKSLGQNFLKDESVIDRIVAALNISEGETVVEIGPGRGALTDRLVSTGVNVIAIEIDRELVPILRTQFHFNPNFKIVEADILTCDLESIIAGSDPAKTKLIGNLPYYISTPIIQHLIEYRHLFSRMLLMLQREVVERLTAKPGESERGFITVMVEDALDAKHLFDVEPRAFFPAPKVWSSVMSLEPKVSEIIDDKAFRRLVSVGFSQKRKTIQNNLKTAFPNASELLTASGIEPIRRAETLTLDEWKKLAGNISRA
ncbi:MAG TPA: 16S rRNA (adenine(1518)-N(6)/adenine(1519)-N(6))-dimethyltransferase RsmA [Pyrinomonadaceae bacterium]|nr:ribosomal RNA small subunit methyltransferase A [Acidobacteriota bacterium]HQZ95143.1 16S rRNA (adenine(1518)-N(6)/adenine(1519)-N(6))-dimethyltransferase RsmA [Pyrinomonadaceae bacterium]